MILEAQGGVDGVRGGKARELGARRDLLAEAGQQ